MIISEKQIFWLIEIAKRYKDVCSQMNWNDHRKEVIELLNMINNQQSGELKEVK